MFTDTLTIKWLIWIVLSLFAGAWLLYTMISEDASKSVFMPGALSAGHHQLEDRCDACHSDAFGGGEVIQQTCVDCHGKDRIKPFDSHPAKKFKDPRNAELLESINALMCISCHTEHKPELTAKDGLTQPVDVCFHCHKDVAKERPSHEGMGFETCKDSGCHNFHNNRALYTDFLIKHIDEPVLNGKMKVPAKEFVELLDEVMEYPRDKYPVKALIADDIDAVEKSRINPDIEKHWLETAHARSGVNCSACHVTDLSDGEEAGSGSETVWNDRPDHTACSSCHSVEVSRFMEGKHGMRLKHGLSAMTPAQAKLPMKADASHSEMTCNSCHGAHQYDVKQAAVESCLGCHDDNHSKAYKQSPHYSLWQEENSGDGEPGSGVSCASCHMPRINYDVSEWSSRIIVDHNQSANFSPNTKMVRSSCLHCHGLEFTLDALADTTLIENNFSGKPGIHIPTMDLARKEIVRRQEVAAQHENADVIGE